MTHPRQRQKILEEKGFPAVRNAIRKGNLPSAYNFFNKEHKPAHAQETLADAFISNDLEMIFFINSQYQNHSIHPLELLNLAIDTGSLEGVMFVMEEYSPHIPLSRITTANATNRYHVAKNSEYLDDPDPAILTAAGGVDRWLKAKHLPLDKNGKPKSPDILINTSKLDELRQENDMPCGLLQAAQARHFKYVVMRMEKEKEILTVQDMLRKDQYGHPLYRVLGLTDQLDFLNNNDIWKNHEQERLAILYRLPKHFHNQINEDLIAQTQKLSYDDYARHIPHETGVQDSHINKLRNKRPIRPKNSGF